MGLNPLRPSSPGTGGVQPHSKGNQQEFSWVSRKWRCLPAPEKEKDVSKMKKPPQRLQKSSGGFHPALSGDPAS
jgi:hypothetical protein